jgi:hypothetical protein
LPLDVDALAAEVVQLVQGALAPLQARLTALEARATTPESIAPDDIAASVAGLLRQELATVALPPRRQKRIERDAHGQIARVIDEPIE